MDKITIEFVLKQIQAAKPNKFIMNSLFENEEEMFTPCGTAACIAGWTVLSFYEPTEIRHNLFPQLMLKARKALALSHQEAEDLFVMDSVSLAEFLNLVWDAGSEIDEDDAAHSLALFDRLNPEIRQQAAVNVLQLMLAEGKIDWMLAIKTAIAHYRNTHSTAVSITT